MRVIREKGTHMVKISTREAAGPEIMRDRRKEVNVAVTNDGNSALESWEFPMRGGAPGFAGVKGAIGRDRRKTGGGSARNFEWGGGSI